jgi:uncharacterized membrane protein YccC
MEAGYGGSVNWNYTAGILLIAVFVCRIALWARFRDDARGRRVGVSTLQLLVVVVAMTVLKWFPTATLGVFFLALAAIVALSFLPAKKTTM